MTDGNMESRSVSPVKIGRHRVGSGGPVFIVAEAGVNHNGSIDIALRMVDAAADAGVDAVKFQMFRAADMVTASAPTAQYQRQSGERGSQQVMLSRLELSPDEFATIKERCLKRGVAFLATPFSVADLTRLVQLDPAAIKIASTDLTSGPLLQAAVESNLPLIVSTGASTEAEIREAVDSLRRSGAGERFALLHCVSCYPTPVEAINLRAIASLQRAIGVSCGLSDHTTSTRMGAWATAAGARLLEKHFTLDQSASGPDHAMSLSHEQLAEYVCEVRDVERALGDGALGMTDLESEVRAVAAKSVVAAMDIPSGEIVTAEMLTSKRPGTGIATRDLDQLVGRRATVSIPRDTVLAWDMVR